MVQESSPRPINSTKNNHNADLLLTNSELIHKTYE
jgi:hypothetical protein